jgi:CheY-like chemotaxis protein/two-component sensor histidine kinase
VEYARTIHSSGTDLLNLINDILDLSKVEAGKMEVNITDVPVPEVQNFVDRTFRPVAEQKGLTFEVMVRDDAPRSIMTDELRLQQVLKNLLSNAFKFTEKGSVRLTIRRAEKDRRFAARTLDQATEVIAFEVADTGIGISKDKQQLIFEAFQQADGTTNRKYGGTGLGLTISRQIAQLLGGEIRVESTPGSGSSFTLFIPARFTHPEVSRSKDWSGAARRASRMPARESAAPASRSTLTGPSIVNSRPAAPPTESGEAVESSRHGDDDSEWTVDVNDDDGAVATADEDLELPRPEGFDDDRDTLEPADRVLLIVENDTSFAKILLDTAREKGFKGVVALDGESALRIAHSYKPDAITLDIDLPGVDGWAVLDRLKHHPDTRHIPVHIISGVRERQAGLKAGAIAYLEKPVTSEALEESFSKISSFIDQQVKRLLVVEDDASQRSSMVELIAHEDVEITAVGSADEALRELSQKHYDCMVLDLGLQGPTDGFKLLETVKSDPTKRDLPIIIYTGKELSQPEETRLRKLAETIIVKDVKSPERLLDETALFLHRVEKKLPEQKRRMLERLHNADAVFAGKRVLIVDDDVRNIFSLTSVLEDHGMVVDFVENGRDAISKLNQKSSEYDLVLMDIMMPDMDGFETTRKIRAEDQFKTLPIIALTAKAMKGDRERCIAAGASDYITKPVDTEQLLSLMRVWLYR